MWTFENRIGEAGAKALFDGVSAQLLKKGFIARGGQIIDATLVPAPKQHNSQKRRRSSRMARCRPAGSPPSGAKDLDATWTKKHGKTTSATSSPSTSTRSTRSSARSRPTRSTHDSQHFDNVFDTVNTSRDVYADRGYPSAEREAWLKENGLPQPDPAKGPSQQAAVRVPAGRNQRIAKTRAQVEHVFRAIDQMGGKLLAHHRPGAANFAMTMMAACYNLKRLVYFQKAGIKGLLNDFPNGPTLDHHTQVMRQQAVKAVRDGQTVQSVAVAYGVNERSVSGWLADFANGGQNALLAADSGTPEQTQRRGAFVDCQCGS